MSVGSDIGVTGSQLTLALDSDPRTTDLDQLACKERSTPSNAASYVFANLDGDVSGSLALPEGKLNPCNFWIASGLT